MRAIRTHLEDLLHEIDTIRRFTSTGKIAFLADDRTQYAVMMAYARIGEITKQIPNEVLAAQPHIEWREIKGFRDVLLHRYFDISIERVWEAVEKLPTLRAATESLLSDFPSEDEEG